jgi:hypothetical protein
LFCWNPCVVCVRVDEELLRRAFVIKTNEYVQQKKNVPGR